MKRHYKLFGTFELIEDGRVSRLMQSPKGSALVSYLIITGTSQPRELLADLLWESSSTTQSLKRLRQIVSRIRPFVPELQVNRQTISFQPTGDTAVDLFSLEQQLTHGSMDLLEKALAVYEAPLLHNFYLNDAPRFNEWLSEVQEQWRRKIFDQYRSLTQTHLSNKMWQRGIIACRRWLVLDDLNEEAYRRLMQLLAGCGELEAALAEYETCRQILWEKLAVEPEKGTVELGQTLLAEQEKAKAVPFSTPRFSPPTLPQQGELAEPGLLPHHSYFPYRHNQNFIGRERELLKLASWLLPQEVGQANRLNAAVITGFGGLGKTQLAVEYAFRYGRYYPGGVTWLSFADPKNVPNEIALAGSEKGLGLYGEADGLPLTDKIGRVQQAWQKPTPRLLIFDNCESEELLSQWWPVTGGCHILVTSRRGYWDQGLGIDKLTLNVLDRAESVHMLKQLAPRLPQDEAEAIAVSLADYPLALHLAGSFLQRYRQVKTAVYLNQLHDKGLLEHPSLQGHGSSYSPTGHELHVARTFAVNSEQLNPEEEVDQMALRLLAAMVCFAPGEPLPQPILHNLFDEGDPLLTSLQVQDGLVRLATLGLIQLKGGEAVVLHRLLAAYAKGMLLPSTLLSEVTVDVEMSLIQLLTEQNKGRYGLAILPFPSTHLNQIIEEALRRSDRRVVQLLLLRGCHQRDHGAYEAAESSFHLALDIQGRLADLKELEKVALLDELGQLYIRMGRYWTAKAYFEQNLTILKQTAHAEPLLLAGVTNDQGLVYAFLGNFEVAEEYFAQAITLYKEILRSNEPPYEYYLGNLAVSNFWKGDYERAHQLMERKMRATQNMLGIEHLETVSTINFIGECLLCMGQIEESSTMYELAHKILQKRDKPHSQTAYNLTGLGQVYLARGELQEAKHYLEKGLAMTERFRGSRHKYTAQTLIQLVDLHLTTGEYEQAKLYLDRAVDIRQKEFGAEHPETAESIVLLGEWTLLAEQNEVKAEALFEEAYKVLEGLVAPTHVAYQRVQRNLQTIVSKKEFAANCKQFIS